MGAIPKPPEGHFNILYFASASSFTSKEFETLPAPLPLRKLFDTLEEQYNGIKDRILSSCLVTVNLNYVDVPNPDDESSQAVIQEGDEVAIIPPLNANCRQSYVHTFHHPGFFLPYAVNFQTPETTSVTSSTKMSVAATDTNEVIVVMVDTWHPSGRVRSSQRSAQCGHTCSSHAGAMKGTRFEFGTQVHDYDRALALDTSPFQ
ncbi:hypothetical protein F5Y05DRAFT_408753 [Hypoxylon sp. FL0543]|nr:hypothetical protein F5Y05DRAFT_408753 [Hypoxylon sp. FL0543]